VDGFQKEPNLSMASMRAPFKVIVVLPAYNEQANISGLLQSISENLSDACLDFQIIVVNDGSSDRTAEILKEQAAQLPLKVYTHDQNQGLGPTIRDGLGYANQISNSKDVIVTMDADETQSPGLILRMVRMIQEGHDVVIASRYQPGARVIGLSLHRRLISYAASKLMRVVFPIRGVRDYTCGYRAYRGDALSKALHAYGDRFVDQDGFQCMVDILLKMRRVPNLVFGEVPLILRYDLKQGESKMRLFRTARKTLLLLLDRRLGPSSQAGPTDGPEAKHRHQTNAQDSLDIRHPAGSDQALPGGSAASRRTH
jgi:dolichol-phosphate mannosyltransferase